MPRHPSFLARFLEPLVGLIWPGFIIWSLITAALWWTEPGWIDSVPNPGLRAGLGFVVRSADALWLLLAAVNLYLDLAQREGIASARAFAATVGVASVAIAWLSSTTGFPLGTVTYTSYLGAKLGPVPLGWPLLWFVLVAGARSLVAHTLPRLPHSYLALLTGVLVALADLNLEPLATRLRFFWFWYVPGTNVPAGAPWQNTATWFIASAALAWFAREPQIGRSRFIPLRIALVFIIANAVFFGGHLHLWLRK